MATATWTTETPKYYVRYTTCQRTSINGWPNNGVWINRTKERVTEGPFDSYAAADHAAVMAMGRDITMPGTTVIRPRWNKGAK